MLDHDPFSDAAAGTIPAIRAGVVTSAGLIRAGTFCTLLATELESLFQVGFTVALGLLVDTFLIRIFLVPSIALLLRSKAL